MMEMSKFCKICRSISDRPDCFAAALHAQFPCQYERQCLQICHHKSLDLPQLARRVSEALVGCKENEAPGDGGSIELDIPSIRNWILQVWSPEMLGISSSP